MSDEVFTRLYHYYPKLHGVAPKTCFYAFLTVRLVTHADQDCIQNTLRPSILRQGLFYGRLIIASLAFYRTYFGTKIAHGRLEAERCLSVLLYTPS